MKLLLHICCAPCSAACIKVLREEEIDVTGYWYNPNIHPFKEYESRLNALKEYSKMIDLNVVYNADDTQKYSYIKCTLYEKHQDILNVISEKEYLEKTPVSLKEYLKMISFVIDNYSPSCKYYKDSNLYLEISAKIDEEKSVTYKVPIKFNNF